MTRKLPRNWPPILILLAVFTTFSPLLTAEFTNWDDPQTVSENTSFQPPTGQSVRDYWHLIEPGNTGTGQIVHHVAGLWVPLTYTIWASLSAVAQVHTSSPGRIELNPYVFHAANVAIHAAASIIVWGILRRLLDSKRTWVPVSGALLFALHPVQVEAVAWVSGLKDVLAGMLGLLAILLYIKHAEPARSRRCQRAYWWGATITLILAMLAKPAAMTVPLLAAVIDRLVLARSWRLVLTSFAVWLLIIAPFAIVAKLAQPGFEFVAPPWWHRPFIVADAIAFYFRKALAPFDLAPDYGRAPQTIWHWRILLVDVLVVCVVAAAALAAWRRNIRRPVAGLLIFVLAPLPVLGFSPFMFQSYSTVADHYLYVAMLGLSMIFGAMLSFIPVRLAGAAAAGTLLILACLTFRQACFWHDTERLFQHTLRVNPRSFAALNNLGVVRVQQGKLDEAEVLFRQAVSLHPLGLQAVSNLWKCLTAENRPQEALEMMRRESKLIRSLPYVAVGPYWLNPNYLGRLLILEGKYAHAARYQAALLDRQPADTETQAFFHLARLLSQPHPSSAPTSAPVVDQR